MNSVEKTAICASIVGGIATAALGGIAAASATTGTIGAVGAAVGGVGGGVLGSTFGIASGGVASAATAPLAAAGAAIGGWAGHVLALFGIGTAPVWAIPLLLVGAAVAIAGVLIGAYQWAEEVRTERV